MELRSFEPRGKSASLRVPPNGGPEAGAIARLAVELACAFDGAAVLLTRKAAAGAALRGAREMGAEPRVSQPGGGGSLSVRAPITLALQGDRATPAFASAAAFVADFAAAEAAPGGAAPDGPLRAKLLQAISKARARAKVALDLPAVASAAGAALGPSHPARANVLEALSALERAEASARVFRTPASWATLLAPSPTGRRAAAFIDLSALSPADGERVEALCLASLSASLPELSVALQGAPVFLVADAPADALGRFAALRLAPWGEPDVPAVFALYLTTTPPQKDIDFPEAVWSPSGLQLPASPSLLPVPALPEPGGALSPAEVIALTPPALRSRLLGDGAKAEDDSEDPVAFGDTPALQTSAESYQALKEASGDLDTLARRRLKSPPKPGARAPQGYEASDFEL